MKIMADAEKHFEKHEEFTLSLEALCNNFISRPVRVNQPHTVVDNTAGVTGNT